MERRQRILLYGDSLLMAGVRASLEASLAFEVIPLDASLATEQDLLVSNPDIVIFDNDSVRPQFHFNLIKRQAELLLIGIDPDSNGVQLWSGRYLRELSVQGLVDVIHQH
ncbi:hypothetical protein EG834_04910 [bacterium]|nr:hypothetical protein [bacterium]